MAITSVRAKFNGSWVTLDYNSATGRYEGIVSPQNANTYYIDLEAANSSGKTTSVSGSSLPALKLVVVDTVAPILTVTSPADGFVTAASSVTVSGKAVDSSGLRSVTVNGTAVTVAADGTFSASVPLSGGSNTITVIATDTAGNSSTVTRTVKRAVSGPVLAITSPAEGALIGAASVQVSGTVSDSVSPVASVTVNGVSAAISGNTWTATVPLSEGDNTITAVAANQVGLSTTATRTVARDTTAPVLALTAPADGLVTAAASVTVSGSVSDSQGVRRVTVNGTEVSVAANGTFSSQVDLSGGANTITAAAEDNAGNTSTVARTVTRATEGPQTAITSPAEGFTVNQAAITVTGTVSDAVSPVDGVTVNGVAATVSGGTFTATVPLSEGDNTITVVARNQVGLTTAKTVSGLLDTVPPVLFLTSPSPGQVVGDASFAVTGAVSDGGSGVQSVTVNGAAAAVSGGAYSRTISLQEGPNHVTAEAEDRAGNTSSVSGAVILDTIPPQLTVDVPAAGLITNQPRLTVSGTASDANLDGVTVNGAAAAVSGVTYTREIVLAEGDNTVTVSAIDKAGHVTTLERSVLLDTREPVLTLVSPPEGWLDTSRPTVVFEASDEAGGSGVDLASAAATVDGSPVPAAVEGTAIKVSPVLADGQHVITVTVRDRAGNLRGLSASYGVDTEPPVLSLLRPDTHLVVDAAALEVAGTALDSGSGVAGVTVAGEAAVLEGGAFSVSVPLEVGVNQITVTAADHAGWTAGAALTVIRLVTDRTGADVARLLDLCKRGMDRWTAEELAWWNNTRCHRGGYDYLDYNRVNTAMEHIHGWLTEKGYLTRGYVPEDRTWSEADAMTLSDGPPYLKNVAVLRGALDLLEVLAPETPPTPLTMRFPKVETANNIEAILVAVDALRPVLEGAFAWPCGMINCGGVF